MNPTDTPVPKYGEIFWMCAEWEFIPFEQVRIESLTKSPEDILIDREIGKSSELSDEAKLVIEVVLNSPIELIENMTMLTKQLKGRLSHRKIEKAYKEIRVFVNG